VGGKKKRRRRRRRIENVVSIEHPGCDCWYIRQGQDEIHSNRMEKDWWYINGVQCVVWTGSQCGIHQTAWAKLDVEIVKNPFCQTGNSETPKLVASTIQAENGWLSWTTDSRVFV